MEKAINNAIEILKSDIDQAVEAQSPANGLSDAKSRKYFEGKEVGLRAGLNELEKLRRKNDS